MHIEQEVNIFNPRAISTAFSSRDTQISAINGKLSVLMTDAEYQAYDDSTGTMHSRLAQAEQDIDSMDLRFSDIDSQFNTISGNFNTVNSRLASFSASIDGLSANIDAVEADLSENYSTTTAMNAAIQASVDGLSSTVSRTYVTNDVAAATYATQTALANASDDLETYADTAMGTAISTATANASDLANTALNSSKAYTDNQLVSYSTTSQMQSAIDQATDSITASVSSRYTSKAEFSALTIGTTNLLRNTKTLAGASASSYGTIETDYDDFAVFSSTEQSSIRSIGVQILPFQNYNDIVRNKTLTLSFMMRSDYASEINADSSQGLYIVPQLKINGTTRGTRKNLRSVPLTADWSKFVYTFVWNDSFVNVPSGTVFDETVQFAFTIGIDTKRVVQLKMFKLEEGEKASSWSPSPFDDEAAISSLASRVSAAELKITDSAIISTVTNSSYWSGLSSRLTTAESSISQNADNIALKVSKDGIISAINQSAESVTIDASKINLSGYVTVTDLSTGGRTTIDGSNITTGSINADRISGGTYNVGGNGNSKGIINILDYQNNAKLTIDRYGIRSFGNNSVLFDWSGLCFRNQNNNVISQITSSIFSSVPFLDITSTGTVRLHGASAIEITCGSGTSESYIRMAPGSMTIHSNNTLIEGD